MRQLAIKIAFVAIKIAFVAMLIAMSACTIGVSAHLSLFQRPTVEHTVQHPEQTK